MSKKVDTSLGGQVSLVCEQRIFLRSAIGSVISVAKTQPGVEWVVKILQEALDYTAEISK